MLDAASFAAAAEQTINLGRTWMLILGLGGLAFGGGGCVSLYKARSERQKNNADAAKVITDAAASLILPLRTEMGHLTARVATLEAEARQQHRLLVEHSVWDHLALAELSRLDVDLPPIPPLFAAAIGVLMDQLDEQDRATG